MAKKIKKGSRTPPNASKRKDNFPNKSWRLTFRYNNSEVELVNSRRLMVIAPPSDKLGKLGPCTGFCCELKTARGRVLYRRFGTNPIQANVEVYGEDSENQPYRVDIENPQGEFDLLVPIVDKAAKIVLLSNFSRKKAAVMKPFSEFSLDNLSTKKRYR